MIVIHSLRIHIHTHYVSDTHTCSHPLHVSISHSVIPTHVPTHTFIHTRIISVIHTLISSHAHTHPHYLAHTHTITQSYTNMCTDPPTHPHSLSHTHTQSHIHTHIFTATQSDICLRTHYPHSHTNIHMHGGSALTRLSVQHDPYDSFTRVSGMFFLPTPRTLPHSISAQPAHVLHALSLDSGQVSSLPLLWNFSPPPLTCLPTAGYNNPLSLDNNSFASSRSR